MPPKTDEERRAADQARYAEMAAAAKARLAELAGAKARPKQKGFPKSGCGDRLIAPAKIWKGKGHRTCTDAAANR